MTRTKPRRRPSHRQTGAHALQARVWTLEQQMAGLVTAVGALGQHVAELRRGVGAHTVTLERVLERRLGARVE